MTDEERKALIEQFEAQKKALQETLAKLEEKVSDKLEDIKNSYIEATTPTPGDTYGAYFLRGISLLLLLLLVYRAFS